MSGYGAVVAGFVMTETGKPEVAEYFVLYYVLIVIMQSHYVWEEFT